MPIDPKSPKATLYVSLLLGLLVLVIGGAIVFSGGHPHSPPSQRAGP